MKNKVAIIGAGIAGLSAGVYLQRQGFQTEIYEMNEAPGGQCTAWKRGRFTFDGCIHWLVGIAPGDPMHTLWEELGALENTQFHTEPVYMKFYRGGQTLSVYEHLDELRKEMLRVSPEDKKEIERFYKAAKKASHIEILQPEQTGKKSFFQKWRELTKTIIPIATLYPWFSVTAKNYSLKYKNPLLQDMMRGLFTEETSMLFNLILLSWMNRNSLGYPLGGSLEFIRRIEKKYIALGGKVNYSVGVKQADLDGGRIVSLALANGKTVEADHFVSSADAHFNLSKLLGGKFPEPDFEKAFHSFPMVQPILLISLGLSQKIESFGSLSGIQIAFTEPVKFRENVIDRALVHSLDFDPSLSPKGKQVLSITVETYFSLWEKLYLSNPAIYKLEKERLAREIISRLEKDFFPGLAGIVEKMDVASPVTWTQYTGVYRGAYEGFQPSPTALQNSHLLKQKIDGIENFYMAGQWLTPGGGLPAAALSGRSVAALISKSRVIAQTASSP